MILSILIPVIPQYEQLAKVLIEDLKKQINGNENIQVLDTNKNGFLQGGPHTGERRQELLEMAIGKYIVFVDADDKVYPYYIEEMLKACASDADCFAINGIMTTDGRHETKWFISKNYPNKDIREGNKMVYYRRTNHITGVKRELALKAGFPKKSNAEDKYYSDRLVLLSEFKIEKPMYHYVFSSKNKTYR